MICIFWSSWAGWYRRLWGFMWRIRGLRRSERVELVADWFDGWIKSSIDWIRIELPAVERWSALICMMLKLGNSSRLFERVIRNVMATKESEGIGVRMGRMRRTRRQRRRRRRTNSLWYAFDFPNGLAFAYSGWSLAGETLKKQWKKVLWCPQCRTVAHLSVKQLNKIDDHARKVGVQSNGRIKPRLLTSAIHRRSIHSFQSTTTRLWLFSLWYILIFFSRLVQVSVSSLVILWLDHLNLPSWNSRMGSLPLNRVIGCPDTILITWCPESSLSSMIHSFASRNGGGTGQPAATPGSVEWLKLFYGGIESIRSCIDSVLFCCLLNTKSN